VVYAHVLGYYGLINKGDTRIYELLIFISGLFMTLVFWRLELRTRELYRQCLDAGEAWEKKNGVLGVYEKLNSTDSKYSHSKTLDIYFRLVLLGFVIFGVFSILEILR
jgi:hypothetical protein